MQNFARAIALHTASISLKQYITVVHQETVEKHVKYFTFPEKTIYTVNT